MIKKVLVTLLVTVDTEDEEICPTGDPLYSVRVYLLIDSLPITINISVTYVPNVIFTIVTDVMKKYMLMTIALLMTFI